MPGYTDGQQEENGLQPKCFDNDDDTIGQGNPYHGDGEDFGTQRDGLVLTEIADVGAQILLMDEPLVQFLGASDVERSR